MSGILMVKKLDMKILINISNYFRAIYIMSNISVCLIGLLPSSGFQQLVWYFNAHQNKKWSVEKTMLFILSSLKPRLKFWLSIPEKDVWAELCISVSYSCENPAWTKTGE